MRLEFYAWVLFGVFLVDLSKAAVADWQLFFENISWLWFFGALARALVLSVVGCVLATAKRDDLKTSLNRVTFGAAIPLLVLNFSQGSISNLSKLDTIPKAQAENVITLAQVTNKIQAKNPARFRFETEGGHPLTCPANAPPIEPPKVHDAPLFETNWDAFWGAVLGEQPEPLKEFAVIVNCGDLAVIESDYYHIKRLHPQLDPKVFECPNHDQYLLTLATKQTKQEAERLLKSVRLYLDAKCGEDFKDDILQSIEIINAREYR